MLIEITTAERISGMVYLDIIIVVNGVMDAFLLCFTAHLLRKRILWQPILAAVMIGQLPIIFILYEIPVMIALSKILVPLAMVGIGLRVRSFADLAKGLLYFSMLAAVCGGIYYAISGWFGFSGGDNTYLELHDLWILPAIALLLAAGCKIWERMHKASLFLDKVLYDAELYFENDRHITIKALLDTGNELRDPLTGSPVMLLEETEAFKILPEKIQQFLQLPWRENPNPWSFIWNSEDYALHRVVFISAKGIHGQTWLPGIRIEKVKITQGDRVWEQAMTVALVQQVLSAESKFQGLLHPEHIQRPASKEEFA